MLSWHINALLSHPASHSARADNLPEILLQLLKDDMKKGIPLLLSKSFKRQICPKMTACPKLEPVWSLEVSPPVFGEDFLFFPCHLKVQHRVGWEILTTSSKVVKPPTTRLMILS